MGEKLLNEELDFDYLLKKINQVVEDSFDILNKKDAVLKWNSIPKLLMLDKTTKKRFLSFVEYIDSSSLTIREKALIIISLSGLVSNNYIKLYDLDNGCLHLLSSFYIDKSFDEINKSIDVIKNNKLLLEVRKKTLDISERQKILSDIEKSLIDDKIDTTDLDQVNKFIEKKIKEL